MVFERGTPVAMAEDNLIAAGGILIVVGGNPTVEDRSEGLTVAGKIEAVVLLMGSPAHQGSSKSVGMFVRAVEVGCNRMGSYMGCRMMGLVRKTWNQRQSGVMGNTRMTGYSAAWGPRHRGCVRSWTALVVSTRFEEESNRCEAGNVTSRIHRPAREENVAPEL